MTTADNRMALTSKQEIMDHLYIQERIYKNFLQLGMPVLYLGGRCYAHKDNLDEFFKTITRGNMVRSTEESSQNS